MLYIKTYLYNKFGLFEKKKYFNSAFINHRHLQYVL